MTHTVTGTYGSKDQLRNAREDLVAVGIPSEKIYVDDALHKLRVLIPEATTPTIVEIFQRHGLQSITH